MAGTPEIESVGAETWRLLSRSWVFAIGGLCIAAALLATIFSIPYPRIASVLFIGGVIAAASAAGYYAFKARKEFMRLFAAKYEYSFLEKGDMESLHGALFQVGQARKVRYVISGEYLNSPIRIFNYSYTVQAGKNTTEYQSTVFDLTFETNLPNIFLIGKWFPRGFSIQTSAENLEFASHPEKVPLTGGFDEFFTLYAPKDYEIEALQIFDTDILEMLSEFKKKGYNFAIELAENRLFLYLNGHIGRLADLTALHDMAKLLVEKLRRELKVMKPGLDAQEETFRRLSRAAEKRV